MKGKKLTEWLANKKVVSSCAAIALAAVIGGVSLFSGAGETPEFPSYTDPIMETSIIEDETPLASQPKTTVKTTSSTKTTRKTVKLKKASKKSYTKKLKTKTKVTNKTNKSGNTTVYQDNRCYLSNSEIHQEIQKESCYIQNHNNCSDNNYTAGINCQ